jgi:hypothetical protein
LFQIVSIIVFYELYSDLIRCDRGIQKKNFKWKQQLKSTKRLLFLARTTWL